MTPDQIAVVTAIANLLREISGWPLGTLLLFIIIGPWVIALVLTYTQGKRFERRFEEVVRMYENNVSLAERQEEVARDLREVVIMNTQAMTKACDAINSNQFCPMVRLEKTAPGRINP